MQPADVFVPLIHCGPIDTFGFIGVCDTYMPLSIGATGRRSSGRAAQRSIYALSICSGNWRAARGVTGSTIQNEARAAQVTHADTDGGLGNLGLPV